MAPGDREKTRCFDNEIPRERMENVTLPTTLDNNQQAPPYYDGGTMRKTLRWLRKHKLATASLCVIIALYTLGIFAQWLAPHDPLYQDFRASYQTPSWDHWLGTDALGRDYFSRILFALRTTIGLTAATLLVGAGFVAVFLGILSGYRGGWIDTVIMRAGEISSLFPALLFMILISATIGPRYHAFMDDVTMWSGPDTIMRFWFVVFILVATLAVLALVTTRKNMGSIAFLATCIALVIFGGLALSWLITIEGFADFFLIFIVLLPFSWYGAALLVRSQVLSLREYEFVLVAKAIGASDTRIVIQHLLPNVLGLVIFMMTSGFGTIAIAEISLTYLGLGVQPPNPSFGSLIFDAGSIRTLEAVPHLLLVPAAIVGLFIYSFSLLGDALGETVSLPNRS